MSWSLFYVVLAINWSKMQQCSWKVPVLSVLLIQISNVWQKSKSCQSECPIQKFKIFYTDIVWQKITRSGMMYGIFLSDRMSDKFRKFSRSLKMSASFRKTYQIGLISIYGIWNEMEITVGAQESDGLLWAKITLFLKTSNKDSIGKRWIYVQIRFTQPNYVCIVYLNKCTCKYFITQKVNIERRFQEHFPIRKFELEYCDGLLTFGMWCTVKSAYWRLGTEWELGHSLSVPYSGTCDTVYSLCTGL